MMHRFEVSMATARTGLIAAALALASPIVGADNKSFRTGFDKDVLPQMLDESGGSPVYGGGAITFLGWERRVYLRTKENYDATSFVAWVTVTVPPGRAGAGTAFFGVGAGFGDCGYYVEPRISPTIYARIFPSDFTSGALSITNSNEEMIGALPLAGGDGTHRVQISWNHATKQFTVAIHQNYAGGPFTPTTTIGAVTATDSFGRNNTRIFFGGSGTYDDLVVVAFKRKDPHCAHDMVPGPHPGHDAQGEKSACAGH